MFFKTCAVGLCFRPYAVIFQQKCVYDIIAFMEIFMEFHDFGHLVNFS